VEQRGDLPLSRFDNPWVAVPGAGDPDASGEVEITAPILAVEVDAFASIRKDRGGLFEQR